MKIEKPQFVYVIAEDVMCPDGEIETRICYNFGSWLDEKEAIKFAEAQNEDESSVENDAEGEGDSAPEYYVKPVQLH